MLPLIQEFQEFIYKPFFSEFFQLVKYYSLQKTAAKLLKSKSLDMVNRGVRLLHSLAQNYPHFRQEIIECIYRPYKDLHFNKYNDFIPQKVCLQKLFIRTLTSIKREDENGFPYLFDISNTAIYSKSSKKPTNYNENEIIPLADYRFTNFKNFYMPGCFFMNINFNGSSFENADVGGSVFYNCSLEHCNFKNTKICGSFLNESIFNNDIQHDFLLINTRLFGTNLHEASLESCKIKLHPEEKQDGIIIINRLKEKLAALKVVEERDFFKLSISY